VLRDVTYIPGGDADQVLSIYLPDEEIRKPPTLLVLGGPNIPFLRHFAKLGYVGVEVHYSEGTVQRGIQNSLCSLAWAYANADSFGFDPQQIVVVGTSLYGEQAALLGVINDPTLYLEECPHPWPEENKPLGVITLAGGLDQVDLDEIDDSDPSFLLVHGLGDVTIEPQQSENFGRALQLAGVEVELVLLPHVSHNSILNNPDTIKSMEDFLIRLAK
jgi:acetyl esterase/lipase